MNEKTAWIEFKVQCPGDAEDLGIALMQQGACGTELISPTEIKCWATRDQATHIEHQLSSLGAQIIESKVLEGTPWMEQCAELWQPITIAGFSIIPVKDPTAATDPKQIYIIPGTGFGTGHHATTFMAGEFLRHQELIEKPPTTILDLGTGSGILAILSAKLFGSPVSAIDNDPLALQNAEDNVRMNCAANLITLKLATLEATEEVFDLIVANIYADVLIPLHEKLAARTAAGGHTILSGIPERTLPEVRDIYCACGFSLMAERTRDGWGALLLKRKH